MANYASVAGGRSHSSDSDRDGELKRELSEMGMYEEGMSSKEMKQLLHAVNESKGNSSMLSNSGQSSPTEAYNNIPARDSSASPELDVQLKCQSSENPKETLVSDETTPEIIRSRESMDNEQIIPPLYPLSPSPARISAEQSTSIMQNDKIPNNLKRKNFPPLEPHNSDKSLELWKIDPLNCEKKLNDKSLSLGRRNFGTKTSTVHQEIGSGTAIELMKLCKIKLIEISNEFYTEIHANYQNKPVAWGAPIKIRLDGAMEKDTKGESSTRIGLRNDEKARASKKKVDDIYDYTEDNDEDDGIFEMVKKKAKPSLPERKQPTRKHKTTKTNNNLITEDIKMNDSIDNDRPKSRKRPLGKTTIELKNNENSSQEFEIIEQPRSPAKKIDTPEVIEVIEETQQYPRRITPPNPYKGKNRGRRLGERVRSSVQSLLLDRPDITVERIGIRKKKDDSLSEQQIEALITDDEEADGSSEARHAYSGKRAAQALAMLTDRKKSEEQKDHKRQEAIRQRNERIDRERQQKVQESIRREQAMLRAKEACENKEKQKNEYYRARLPIKLGRRTELEGEQSNNRNLVDWPPAGPSNISSNSSQHRLPTMPCPICQKLFTEGDEIAVHAQNCTDYPNDDDDDNGEIEEINRSPTPETILCHICNRFRTRDGNDLEDHVARCIARAKNEASGSNSTPIDVPDSPIYSYQPSIDYNGQVDPIILANKNVNSRKRRRT